MSSRRYGGIFLISIFSVLFLSSTPAANAQASTAQVKGTVYDQTGAVVPGVQVNVTHTATGIVTAATTNDQGMYAFSSLSVGSYTIDVKATGFSPYRQNGLVLTVGQQLKLDIALKIGASEQVVTVTADTVAVDATSPTEQSTVEEKVVSDLPLNGRNAADLVFTVAGTTNAALNQTPNTVSSSFKNADTALPSESAPTIHGSRPGGVYFSLDGANNTDPSTVIGGPFPNPDATGEFSVVTGTYGARYVSAPGGAINIITKSGTNKVHGSLFEFVRNGYFNARNALATEVDPATGNVLGVPDVLKRNQFGGAVGGPILRDKMFFFGSYQSTIVRDNQTTSGAFPTAAMRTGDFTAISPGFKIPSYYLGSATTGSTAKLLKVLPTPVVASGQLNYQIPQASSDQQAVIKLDYAQGSHRLFLRSFFERYALQPQGMTPSALLLAEHQGYKQPWFTNAVGDTWSKGKWVFDSRASLLNIQSSDVIAPQVMGYSALGMSNISGYAPSPGIGGLYVVDGFYGSNGAQSYAPRRELELSENVYGVFGKHQLSLGADYQRVSSNTNNYSEQNPVVVYVGVNSYIFGLIPAAYGGISGAVYSPMADLVLGMPYEFLQKDGIFAHYSGNLFGMYGEDTYQVSKKLTATAGLRWDPFLPYTADAGRVSCFVPGTSSTVFTNALPGLLFPGDSGCPAAGVSSTLKAFEPRVGLAYQLGNKGKTVIRSGYGMYNLQLPLGAFLGFAEAQPWVRQYTVVQYFYPGVSSPLSIDNLWGSSSFKTDPFAAGFQGANFTPTKSASFAKGLNASTFAQHFHPGYVQQWSFSLQQVLTSKDSLDVAYIGSTGVHLTLGESENTAVAGVNPFPNFGQVAVESSDATSSYNGLDVTFRHRSKNVTLSSAFTWGKSLDDASSPSSLSSIQVPYMNNHNFHRGLSDFDQNLVFRTTGTWSSPELKNWNRLAQTTLGSWALSGLLTLDAGQPFSVSDGNNKSGTGLGLDLADRVSGKPVWVSDSNPVYHNHRLNAAAFTDNAAGTFGNSGRNAYRSQGLKDVDLAAMKTFPVYEQINLIFRAEAFNISNHANYGLPNSAYGGSTFGYPTLAQGARIMQFSLKLSF